MNPTKDYHTYQQARKERDTETMKQILRTRISWKALYFAFNTLQKQNENNPISGT
jgi:hypothetical protein